MSEKIWSDDAWEDYIYWQTQDKKTIKRINQLIQDIERNGCCLLYTSIGLFIAFIGLQNAKIVVNSDATLLTYQTFKGDTFHSIGIGAILALIGVLVTAILLVRKIKGGILLGIIITWVLGIICELTLSLIHIYTMPGL